MGMCLLGLSKHGGSSKAACVREGHPMLAGHAEQQKGTHKGGSALPLVKQQGPSQHTHTPHAHHGRTHTKQRTHPISKGTHHGDLTLLHIAELHQ